MFNVEKSSWLMLFPPHPGNHFAVFSPRSTLTVRCHVCNERTGKPSSVVPHTSKSTLHSFGSFPPHAVLAASCSPGPPAVSAEVWNLSLTVKLRLFQCSALIFWLGNSWSPMDKSDI